MASGSTPQQQNIEGLAPKPKRLCAGAKHIYDKEDKQDCQEDASESDSESGSDDQIKRKKTQKTPNKKGTPNSIFFLKLIIFYIYFFDFYL